MGEWDKASEKGRALRMAESFRHLAEVFQNLPERKEELGTDDLEEIYQSVREQVCSSCGKRADCWGRDYDRTVRLTYELLAAVAEDDGHLQADSAAFRAKEQFQRHCIRGFVFADELRNSFCRARIHLMWSNRMLENRAAVGEQLQETAQIIREIACTVFEAGEVDSLLERRIKNRLKLQSVHVRELRVAQSAGHPEMILTARTSHGHCVPVKLLADTISKACGRSFVPERDSRLTVGREQGVYHFVEDTRYYMLTGHAQAACAGQAASGDNFSVLTGSHGQVILGISDGMGSGAEAKRESQTVIELLEQFLGAGFSAETAVRMINSAMMLQRGMRSFSTLDICGISLYSGQCEFLKIGAATTFIRRAGWVETVTSASLPIGMFREVDFERARKRLEHGDMIVMMSDGVLDALPREEGEELMKYLILQADTDNPAELAQILIDQVRALGNGEPADDMTILAGGIWKK